MNRLKDKEEQTRSSFHQLWRLTAGQRKLFAGAALAMIIANGCLFVPPLLGKFVIDVLSEQDTSQAMPMISALLLRLDTTTDSNIVPMLWLSGALSVLITLIAGGFQYLRGRFTALASETIAEHLRLKLYARLHDANASFFAQSQTGDLVQRCSSDVETLRTFLASNLIDISRSLTLLICVVPVLFWINTTLAWVSLCLMPLIVIGSYLFFSHVKQLFLTTDEAEGRMTACLQENLTGIRVVRAFNRQEFEINKFARCNSDYRDCNYRMLSSMSYFWALSDLVCFSQVGIVLIGGAFMTQNGLLSLGDLFAFITYVAMVVWPIRHLGRVLVDSGMSMVALGRINHILLQPSEAAGLVPAVSRTSGAIRIRKLSFSYIGDHAENVSNLSDISLDINVGETLAIVGAPGSGKTTLINVLLKLYDYQHGSIELDGLELKALDRHWLREQFAVVFQEPFLFSRTIASNLRMASSSASDSDLRTACGAAALHDSIAGFNDGYNALIGERGVTLSGGQRQRLALARALVKQAPILVLDDALSAIDSRTEQSILNALQVRRDKRTTLIIAHRLSTTRFADRIVVMDEGQIVQLGTHHELANQPGHYQRLCVIQNELDRTINTDLNNIESTALSGKTG